MKLLGFGCRDRKVFFSVTLVISSFCFQSFMVAEPQPQAPSGISAGSVIELIKTVITNFGQLNYYTSKEFIVPLPVINQDVVLDWKERGSGYLFDSFKTVRVAVRSNQTVGQAQQGTLAVLGETLTKYVAYKSQQQLELLQWLSGASVGPLKLFCIKLLLLSKHVFETKDFSVLQAELPRLLFKLSLDEEVMNMATGKSLSSYLPELLKRFIEATVPSLLDVVDSMWDIMSNKDCATAEAHLRSIHSLQRVEAFVFNSEDVAKDCLALIKSFDAKTSKQSFSDTITFFLAAKGYQLIHSYDDFMRLKKVVASPAQGLPVSPARTLISRMSWSMADGQTKQAISPEMLSLVAPVKTMPAIRLFTMSDGTCLLVYVTNHLNFSQSMSLMCGTLMYLFKKYVAIRKDALKNSPSLTQEKRNAYLVREKESHKVTLFLATDAGAASTKRLDQMLKNIEAYVLPDVTVTTDSIKKAYQDLEKDETSLIREQKQLETFVSMDKQNPSKALTNIIQQKKQTIAALELSISNKKNNISLLEQGVKTQKPETEMEIRKRLSELKTLEQRLKNQGDGDVTPELVEAIKGLEEKLAQKTATIVPLAQRLAIRENQANVYRQEKELIIKAQEKRQQDINVMTNSDDRMVENIKFKAYEKGLFDAYINYLEKTAQEIEKENKNVLELEAYRKAHASLDPTDISEQDAAYKQELEITVGHILDNRSPNTLLGKISADPELKEFVIDLYSNKQEFKELKNLVFDAVTFIVRQSDHFQNPENMIFYEAIIKLFAPEFWSTFQQITAEL